MGGAEKWEISVNDSDTKTGVAAPKKADEPEKPKPTPPHPVGAAIDNYVHRIRDIELAGRIYTPAAEKEQMEQLQAFGAVLPQMLEKISSTDAQSRAVGIINLFTEIRRFTRIVKSNPGVVMSRSLFLGLFAAFDAFTGQLIEAIFARRSELYKTILRTISFQEVLSAPDLQSLRSTILGGELEDLRRKSYVDQFAKLREWFEIKTLTDFPNWARFIECAQRRNLLTHCDGVVSREYLSKCKAAGCAQDELPKLGESVQLSQTYFLDACELMIEVGAKLGHTLWRKLLPDERPDADKSLNNLLYDALEIENWPRAKMLGKFACDQKEFSDESMKKHFTVNYIQAIKWAGPDAEARELLDEHDWSALSLEFRLAAAVLKDANDEAAGLMRQIGKRTKIIDESSYHTWPLFRMFRSTEQFEKAYNDVYGYAFIGKAKESANAAVQNANQLQAQKGSTASSGLGERLALEKQPDESNLEDAEQDGEPSTTQH